MQKFYGGGAAASVRYYRNKWPPCRIATTRNYSSARRAGRASRFALAVIVIAVTLNLVYQVARKPAELFFPVSGALSKTPTETWRNMARCSATSTSLMTPELLAALAQVEAAGNPVARMPARASVIRASSTGRPSSAVGMYQITDGTFREARRYCIRDHVAIEEGCWLNSLYMRVIPSHAVEMTSAYLDRSVAALLAGRRVRASVLQKQDLAALIHLCGARAGELFVRNGFRLMPGQRCGEHDARAYLAQVNAMKRVFARLSALG